MNTATADPPGLEEAVATAVVGVDTLWGGDVLSASGTGRFVADSWFSDRPLPPAYDHPTAAALRACGGVTAPASGPYALAAYLDAIDVPGAVAAVRAAAAIGGLRGAWLDGLGQSLEVMLDLALEQVGRGPAVPYERCVLASTGREPSPAAPEEKRERLAALLSRAGHATGTPEALLAAVDRWRAERLVPPRAFRIVADALVAQLDAAAGRRLAPLLPAALREVPRANITFLPLPEAWFSGSMNYLGRERTPEGAPRYEATYEINASLQISAPELVQLVAHEVVPGHVTTFALLQAQHARGAVGFEGTVLTMCTRASTLFEGIANNALLLAHGARALEELPDPDLQVGALLALLQDDAKSQASWLRWRERAPRQEVAAALRREFLCSEERADKLSGAWAGHPLLGRMYLPAYRAGTEKVAALLRAHPPERLVPALFGAAGLVDVVTIDAALRASPAP